MTIEEEDNYDPYPEVVVETFDDKGRFVTPRKAENSSYKTPSPLSLVAFKESDQKDET